MKMQPVPPQMPETNPNIMLGMSLDQFNQMQAVLAKQPFETIADLILNFRHQVAVQIERIRTAQQAEMMPNPPSVETGE